MEDIGDQLQPGEKLLWEGRPRSGFIFRPEQIPSMIVGGLALVAAFSMLADLLRFGVDWIPLAMCAVFAAAGLYLTYGILALDKRCRSSASYAVTDRRIIIKSDSPFVDAGSLSLLRLNGKPQPVKIGADGSIHFGSPMLSHARRFWGPVHRMVMDDPRLDCLEHPLRVYRVIRGAQRGLQRLT